MNGISIHVHVPALLLLWWPNGHGVCAHRATMSCSGIRAAAPEPGEKQQQQQKERAERAVERTWSCQAIIAAIMRRTTAGWYLASLLDSRCDPP